MPERWEREIEKLGTLTAPRWTSKRIAEGPHGDRMPPAPRRGQRAVAALLALTVFAGASVLAARAFRQREAAVGATSEGGTSVVIHLRSDGGPTAVLDFRGETAEPQIGSYCWIEGGTGRCVDTALSRFNDPSFVSVPEGTPIAVDAPGDRADVTIVMSPGDDPAAWIRETGPVSPTRTVDGQPGTRNLLIVTANWPEGSVQFFFPIEIGDPGATVAAVPNVVGLDKHDALNRLMDAGFQLVSVSVPSGEAAGIVTSQDPPPGTIAATTTTIRPSISTNG